MVKTVAAVVALASGWVSAVRGQDVPPVVAEAPAEAAELGAYERREYRGGGGRVLPYRVLLPKGYDKRDRLAKPQAAPSGGWPLVLFMHGAGERGDDNARHLKFGAELFLRPEVRERFPAIVVFPQCPAEGYWVSLEIRRKIRAKPPVEQDFHEVFDPPTPELAGVMGLVEKLVAEEAVDAERVYVIGMSMGAMGTYELLARMPERWAAAVAICGGGNVEATERYGGRVPVWITHGDRDEIVPVEYSRRLVRALAARGAEVRYTELAGVAHDAWTPTLEMEGLLEWVFAKRRGE